MRVRPEQVLVREFTLTDAELSPIIRWQSKRFSVDAGSNPMSQCLYHTTMANAQNDVAPL